MHPNETDQPIDRPDTRERLVRATLEVIYEEGYDQATTRRIAERASVNLQLIQYHFKGKEGLIATAQEQARLRYMTLLEPAVLAAPDLKGAIRAGIALTWDQARSHPELMQPDLLLQIRRASGQAPGHDLPARETQVDLSRLLDRVRSRTGERLAVPIAPFILLMMSGTAGLLMEYRISGDDATIGAAFALLAERLEGLVQSGPDERPHRSAS